ncbi:MULTISPECIES: leucine-rich repeat protein [Bacteroides]|uniref:BACON domain-containing protein n=1 Tax=Bacteroides acidifaciens TaxID=85831 RepID=A0A4S2AG03_9BACE|nr:leucine-rich repeat protein [Bacteroides acidifaciens]TGX99562.1 hypothetical protein E5356_15470 [Bacteroides acidifaciens]
MRTLRLISTTLLMVVLCLNFTFCSDGNEVKEDSIILLADDTQQELFFSEKEETKEIKFTSTGCWYAFIDYAPEDWITVTPTEGGAGENAIFIKVNSNNPYSDKRGRVCIATLYQTIDIVVIQEGRECTQNIEVAGTLDKLLGTYDIHKLKLTGYLNGTDVATIRKMPLTEIDLSNVNIVGGGTYTVHYNRGSIAGEYKGSTSDNVFPSCFFYNKPIIQSVVLPNTITMIDDRAFAYCENLSSIVIPDGVTKIGMEAFDNCKGLTSVTIPKSVTEIGSDAFRLCESITSITIPNSVTKIKEGAFWGCTNLTSIIIPNSVIGIDKYAFGKCSGVTSIVIGNGIKRLPAYVFSECTNLSSVIIPANVETIEDAAFENCSALKEIHVKSSIPPTVNNSTFSTYSHVVLYVPTGSKEAYQNHNIWGKFGTIVEE